MAVISRRLRLARHNQRGTIDATPYDLAQWRALQSQTSLPLYAPSSWSASLGYDQFRAYSVRTPSGLAKAAVAVGTTPQGGYWDVQALAWTDPPILLSPNVIRTIAGRSYSLYYDGAQLHMVAWQVVTCLLGFEHPRRRAFEQSDARSGHLVRAGAVRLSSCRAS